MLPSEALKAIFQAQYKLESNPYIRGEALEELEQAYKDFDDAIQSSLLELIKNSDKDSSEHHERLIQPWLNDPEYKKALHQYDHELNQSNKGDK